MPRGGARKGAGLPALGPHRRIHVNLTMDQIKAIKAIVGERGVNAWIREAIRRRLENGN